MKQSFTKQDESRMAAHIARAMIARLVQLVTAVASVAAAILHSWHWLLIGAAFIWIIGKAAPPDSRLDDITGR
jgi:hypothetical protein